MAEYRASIPSYVMHAESSNDPLLEPDIKEAIADDYLQMLFSGKDLEIRIRRPAHGFYSTRRTWEQVIELAQAAIDRRDA